jgi:hypothetical protein
MPPDLFANIGQPGQGNAQPGQPCGSILKEVSSAAHGPVILKSKYNKNSFIPASGAE